MEGQRSRRHFVQNCTERKQIGSLIQILALPCSGDMYATVPSVEPGLVR